MRKFTKATSTYLKHHETITVTVTCIILQEQLFSLSRRLLIAHGFLGFGQTDIALTKRVTNTDI